MKRALFSIRNRWIPSPAENNDRAQISSRCWNDGCTKGSESGCVQGFGARLTKKIGKCVLKCVLAKEKAVDSNESTAFILVEVTGLEPAASWSQTTRATNCATPRSYNLLIIIHKRRGRQALAQQKSSPVVFIFQVLGKGDGLLVGKKCFSRGKISSLQVISGFSAVRPAGCSR